MRNSDKVSFVCFSNGGARGAGKSLGTKVRYTNDRTRYTKALGKIGITEITWVNLPAPMTKAGALTYLSAGGVALLESLGTSNTASISAQVYQDAIAKAVQRLAPAAKSPKPQAKTKNKTVTGK